jgi:hypothetical protein
MLKPMIDIGFFYFKLRTGIQQVSSIKIEFPAQFRSE